MSNNNGGVIGAPNNPTTTAAPGMWGMNSMARHLASQNSYWTWPSFVDPSFSSVSVLSHFEEMGGSTGTSPSWVTAIGSAGTKVSTLTPIAVAGSGNQTGLSEAQAKFGLRSGYIDASATTGFKLTQISTEYTFGTGDWTVELFFWKQINGTQQGIIDWRQGTEPQTMPMIYHGTDNKLHCYINGAERITGTGTVTLSAWNHIALCKASGTTRMYLNGTQDGSNYTDGNNYSTSAATVAIGCLHDTAAFSSPAHGFFDELRITKGVGRYTGSTLTVPTAPFPDY